MLTKQLYLGLFELEPTAPVAENQKRFEGVHTRCLRLDYRSTFQEAPLPSLMGLDVATPPNLGFGGDKRQRSRSRSVSPHIAQATSTSERKKSKKKKTDRVKGEPHTSRTRKSEKEQKVKKTNENEDVAREIADEEAIDGTLREVAEVRVLLFVEADN